MNLPPPLNFRESLKSEKGGPKWEDKTHWGVKFQRLKSIKVPINSIVLLFGEKLLNKRDSSPSGGRNRIIMWWIRQDYYKNLE